MSTVCATNPIAIVVTYNLSFSKMALTNKVVNALQIKIMRSILGNLSLWPISTAQSVGTLEKCNMTRAIHPKACALTLTNCVVIKLATAMNIRCGTVEILLNVGFIFKFLSFICKKYDDQFWPPSLCPNLAI